MMGNVWEWVDTPLTPVPEILQRFKSLKGPLAQATAMEAWYGIRGGAFDLTPSNEFLDDTGVFPARFGSDNIGFRCARSVTVR